MPNDFDWRYPDFDVRPLGDNLTPQQRVKQYVKKAPKRTAKRVPKTTFDHYVWDKGMTFAEKAEILSKAGVFGTHTRETPFTQDLDRYNTPTEQLMDILRNSSSHVQKYYGVYDDIQAERKAQRSMQPKQHTQPRQATPQVQRPRQSGPVRVPSNVSRQAAPVVEVPAVPEVIPQTDLSGPTTAAALAAAELMSNRIPEYSPAMLAMHHGRQWSPVTDMNGNTIIARNNMVGNEYNAYMNNQAQSYGYGGCILPDIVLF